MYRGQSEGHSSVTRVSFVDRFFADRRRRGGQFERLGEQHRGLACDPDVAEAIRAVTCHFEIDGEIAADACGVFMVQTGQHQPPLEFLDRHVEVQVVFQPIPGNKHRAIQN